MFLGPERPTKNNTHSAYGLKRFACPSCAGEALQRMPANRPKREKRTDTRLRVAFSGDERALLVRAAGPDGLKQAAYVRAAVVKMLGVKAPMGPIAEDDSRIRTTKLKTTFTPAEEKRIAALAAAHGLTRAEFVRHVVLTAAGQMPRPVRKRKQTRDELLQALSVMSIQIKKLGTNINQLAHQANAGMVPVSRAETQYMLNAHQILLSKATAAVESLLA